MCFRKASAPEILKIDVYQIQFTKTSIKSLKSVTISYFNVYVEGTDQQ